LLFQYNKAINRSKQLKCMHRLVLIIHVRHFQQKETTNL
jgi:hypothetical protein